MKKNWVSATPPNLGLPKLVLLRRFDVMRNNYSYKPIRIPRWSYLKSILYKEDDWAITVSKMGEQ